jgi:hypothetical protein
VNADDEQHQRRACYTEHRLVRIAANQT